MKNKTMFLTLTVIITLAVSVGCVSTKKTNGSGNSTGLESIMQDKIINHRISAHTLGYYHNKVYVSKTCCVINGDTNDNEDTPLDSLAYMRRLLEYSIHDSELAYCLRKRGMMQIDSIMYGVNVLKLYVSQDTNRYIIYSVVSDGQESRCNKGKELIKEGNTYYLELIPYFNPQGTDYHNSGLYLDGIVIRDFELPIEEWKNVYTTNNLDGYYYITK